MPAKKPKAKKRKDQQLQDQAAAQVEAILGPQTASLNTAFTNQGASLQAAYAALAEMQKQVAPAIEQSSDAAEARQAVIAKGFSDGYRQASEQSASQLQGLLPEDSPQQIRSAGAAGADVLFGLGGAIPANTLNQQGAAFANAARFLPGQASQLGLDALKSTEQARIQALQGLEGKRPELFQNFLNDILNRSLQERNLDIQEKYLLNTVRKTGAEVTGVDPVTGLPTADATAAAAAGAGKKQAARAKAVAKKNEETIGALIDAEDWVEGQLTPDSQPVETGRVPVRVGTRKVGKDSVIVYAKQGGGTTTDAKQAVTKPVYEQQPLPKKEWRALRNKLISRLTRQLRRFGYKPAAIAAMADDILDDYFTVAEKFPPSPDRPKPPPGDRRSGR